MSLNIGIATFLSLVLAFINKINIYFLIFLILISIIFNKYFDDGNLYLLICVSILIYFLYIQGIN